MDHLKKRGLELPLIQGGMGVGVSLSGLAGAVAKTGAMGSISTADCGYRFRKNDSGGRSPPVA